MEAGRTPTSAAKRKAMYKCGSPVAWREEYKNRCKERLKGSRSKLLDKYRKIETAQDSGLEKLMNEEWLKMRSEGFPSHHFESFDDILITLENIKKELLEWETETILQMESNTINADIDHHELNDSSSTLLCPICNAGYLAVQSGFLICSCGLNINLEQDSLSLANVKACLEEGVSGHSKICNLRPQFSLVDNFGNSNLMVTCSGCDFMFIVV
uniref:RPA-interacting protein A-like n=1 Tax=Phallusia mammillata TaxID=59560 RepID=A0A6F9DRQ8_9ASCI|nr:RPA-interacting protein A-like [Phallusia mammillata]